MNNIYKLQSQNKFKSGVIIVLFTLFFALAVWILGQAFGVYAGYRVGGIGYAGIALIISGVASFTSYYFSDKIVLSISQARPADRQRDFEFYTVAENLALAAGIPKPQLYVIEDSATNAFATGRDPEHAVVCATRGLLDKLNRTELEGVVAHELTHIINYDIRLMSIVSVMVGSLALLGDWFMRASLFSRGSRDNDRNSLAPFILLLGFLFAILSPIIANLIKLAISRRREFMADAGAVSITHQPSGLISALKKISTDQEPLEVANKATAHLYIANPFKKDTNQAIKVFASLFNTHPPIEERLEALHKLS